MNTTQARVKRIVLAGILGAVVGPVIGFGVGVLGTSGVWLVAGLIERWPAGELAQGVPWAIILAIICAVVSCPTGALVGSVLLMTEWHARSRWQYSLVGTVIGLVVGGSSTPLIWNLHVNGAIALLTTAILGLTGALTGPIVVELSRRSDPRAAR
jgi:hypothetical protein